MSHLYLSSSKTLEIAAEDASTVILDLSDEAELEDKSQRLYQAVSNIESALISLVSNSTDLASIKNSSTVETLANEVSFSISDIDRNITLLAETFEQADGDLYQDLISYINTVKENGQGTSSLANAKLNHIRELDQATNNLSLAECKKPIQQSEQLTQLGVFIE